MRHFAPVLLILALIWPASAQTPETHACTADQAAEALEIYRTRFIPVVDDFRADLRTQPAAEMMARAVDLYNTLSNEIALSLPDCYEVIRTQNALSTYTTHIVLVVILASNNQNISALTPFTEQRTTIFQMNFLLLRLAAGEELDD